MSYPTGLTGNTKKAYDRISARAKTSSKAESLQFVINTGLCDATACDAMADLSDEALDQLIEDVGGGAPHDIARYLRTAFAWVPMKVLGDRMSADPISPIPVMRAWRLALGATGLLSKLFGRTRQHEAEREQYNRAASRLVAQRELAGALHVLAWRAQRAAESSIVR